MWYDTLCFLFSTATKHGSQRGVPRLRMLNNNLAKKVDERVVYDASTAVQFYQQQGGHLRDPYQVGKDPLVDNTDKWEMRHQAFCESYPSFEDIFTKTVNSDSSVFSIMPSNFTLILLVVSLLLFDLCFCF